MFLRNPGSCDESEAIAKIINGSKGVDAWTDVSFKRLEDDRMWFRGTAYFKKLDELEITKLNRPAPAVTGIKEISGTLQYRVSGRVKEVDLGFESLKAGSKGTELGASIEGYKEGWQKNGSQDMELKLRLDPDNLKTAYLVVDGVKTEIKRSGYSGMNGVTTFTFESKTAFPEKGGIAVELYDKLQAFDTPFKIEDLSLLGVPLDGASESH